ncbi:hypothetical protein BS50DRAFT_580450 [Corynespora cassiicola Philippines]|uniref:Uncharacterized protein n=1 Tax=Corynespora cassiicola Philippines TaxID=1448308 RepID=A0A2T2N0M3_CORCC|nr:hypothetical protein BS50DRAFT_580450 [Corynespora cassiicola Philippines]
MVCLFWMQVAQNSVDTALQITISEKTTFISEGYGCIGKVASTGPRDGVTFDVLI